MKVYCKNCKYFQAFYNFLHNRFEECTADKKIKHTYLDTYPIYRNPSERNSNNDCPKYHRKWWKVWVK